jgi:hypothetical protein
MANNTNDLNESRRVAERLRALRGHGEFQPDTVRAWTRLQERQQATARWRRRMWAAAAAATVGLVLLALPSA